MIAENFESTCSELSPSSAIPYPFLLLFIHSFVFIFGGEKRHQFFHDIPFSSSSSSSSSSSRFSFVSFAAFIYTFLCVVILDAWILFRIQMGVCKHHFLTLSHSLALYVYCCTVFCHKCILKSS